VRPVVCSDDAAAPADTRWSAPGNPRQTVIADVSSSFVDPRPGTRRTDPTSFAGTPGGPVPDSCNP